MLVDVWVVDGWMGGWMDGWMLSENILRAVGDVGYGCKVLSFISQGKLCLHSFYRFQVLNIFLVPIPLNQSYMWAPLFLFKKKGGN